MFEEIEENELTEANKSLIRVKDSIETIRKEIPTILIDIVDNLINLVKSSKIERFSFKENTEPNDPLGEYKPKYIYIVVESKKIQSRSNLNPNELHLGVFESLEKTDFLKIKKSLLPELETLNSNLLMLNKYCSRFLPETQYSWYSNMNLSDKSEKFRTLPQFYIDFKEQQIKEATENFNHLCSALQNNNKSSKNKI